jgi:tetratricopeptide (TPR) repeat protein
MTTSSAESPTVFISYTHDSPEHMDRVLELAERLIEEGFDCQLDQYEMSPPEGWPRWSDRQIGAADYVLVVCTETYLKRFKGTEETGKGLGAQWEGAIITQELYEASGNNDKFIPVLFSPEDSGHIPHILRGVQSYDVFSDEGYTKLYRRLTNQPWVTKPERGSFRLLPTRERKQFFLTSSWNIPYTENPFFTGREDVLARLHDELMAKGTAAVSGMPGVGKTQTAVEYAHRHRSEYKLILWARAETRETLISDYLNIATTLQLSEVRAQEQDLAVRAVKRWFDANPDWLLILDNADDLTLTREFLPTTPKGRIVLTTRAQATGAIATNVEVLKMEEGEGAFFLLRRAKFIAEDATLDSATVQDRNKAKDIATEVDGLPLALDQAGAFIEESSSSPAEYLDLYRTQGADLRKRRGEHVLGHPESVEITFSLSFDKVEAASPIAADLLRACAFLAPDAIPEEIFTEGGSHLGDTLASTVNNRLAFIDALKETLRYSLLRRDPDKRALFIHRVVQEVLKDRMEESARPQWAMNIIKAINHVLPNFNEMDQTVWHCFERILPHVKACTRLIETYDFKFIEIDMLLNNMARYLHNRARLTEAEPLYIITLRINELNYGQTHQEVATSLHNLGWLKFSQGKYTEAEPLFFQALEIMVNTLGQDEIATAEILKQLGWLKYKQGKYSEANTYFQQAIDKLGEVSMNKSHILADTLHGLSSIFIRQAKFTQAETLLRRALDIIETNFGGEHYFIANLLKSQARLYKEQKQYPKAETLYLRARKLLENTFGSVHPHVAGAINDLATLYYDQGKLVEAETLNLEALAIQETIYGQDNSETASSLHNLATIYVSQGDFDRAEKNFQLACEITEKTLGVNHPSLASSFGNFAVLYSNQGRYAEAETFLKRAIVILKSKYPPSHPELLTMQGWYAGLLQRMNRKGEAQRLADYVKKMRARRGGKRGKK